MSDILVRIKRAVLAGHYAFSEKARLEMEADGLTELDVAESILNAVAIYKTLHSRSPFRGRAGEHLYVIQSPNLEGLAIYSKGKVVRESGWEVYYFLISSKRAM
jgi:hypothetical protein